MKINKIAETEELTVNIRKIPIGKYADLLRTLKEIIPEFDGLTIGSNKDFLAKVPDLVANNIPASLKVIEIGAELTPEQAASRSLDEIIDIIFAIIEVNKYTSVWEKIKKGVAEFQKKPEYTKAMEKIEVMKGQTG